MIDISDFKKIKKICFDKIASETKFRQGLFVEIKPIDTQRYQIIMKNGEDYARYIGDLTKMCALPCVKLCWEDFNRICNLFSGEVEINVAGNIVTLSNQNNTMYKCSLHTYEYNNDCNFNFDFNDAIEVNMDKSIILKKLDNIQKFAITQNKIISTDGYICIINKMKFDIGDKLILLTKKIPDGTWLFNLDKRIIVSKDKKMACTFKKASGTYPVKGILALSEQYLNNWFECNVDDFRSCLERCSSINNKITINPTTNALKISTKGDFGFFQTEIKANFEHTTTKKKIIFSCDYLINFCRCAKDNKIKIFFDDNTNEYKLKTSNDDLIIFGAGCEK